ncbi:MAG: hypothetical protein GVY06_10140 [Alphaproteobacteria bacterium]|jgi:bifunctional DNA-binding transcriptional regulator/antitoxin component of YhaV-PrlF toxin-antitoxin module|nr:hypothetical protein [Alphaproteobacteria bacterium]
MPDDQTLQDAPESLEFEVTINEDGRLVIPKPVRELMGIDGEKATLRLKADRTGVTLRSRVQGLRYAQALFQAHANIPEGQSAADLIREGRIEDMAATEAKWRRIYGDDG